MFQGRHVVNLSSVMRCRAALEIKVEFFCLRIGQGCGLQIGHSTGMYVIVILNIVTTVWHKVTSDVTLSRNSK